MTAKAMKREPAKPLNPLCKIQIPSAHGWADLKTCGTDGIYRAEHYNLMTATGKELDEIAKKIALLNGVLVPDFTPADDDLY